MDVQKLWRTTGLLLMVLLVSGQALAKDGRNLAVNQVNNAVSEQRIALVIGNSAYTNSPLKNPVNDAKDVASKLRGLGFDVIERNNLQTKQIGATLREFRSKLVPGAVALVFYAGHGLQIKGDNYLPAVDADINSEEDVPNQSLAMKQIMDVLDESKTRLNLVFLDACRNNPYARSFRSADKGLARVSAPSGTLISYATRPGSVAADGGGRNGLYTSKLLAQMDSHLQIEQTLKRVVTEVKVASQGKQEPWMEGSIEGDFCFAGCNTGVPVQGATAQPAPAVIGHAALELDAWNTAREMNTEEAYQAYLADHADGRHAKFAQAAINKLKIVQLPAQIAMHTPSTVQSGAEASNNLNKNSEQLKGQEAERQRQQAEEAQKGYVSQGGLTWMPITFTKTWAEANSYCTNTPIRGQSGWRLPTKDELKSLYDSGVMKGHGWKLHGTWSSTPGGSFGHDIVTLYNGDVNSSFDMFSLLVSCVR